MDSKKQYRPSFSSGIYGAFHTSQVFDELPLDDQLAKKLFADIQNCDFDAISPTLDNLGGKSTINHLRSPYGRSKQRIWLSVVWKNNKIKPQQKLNFLRKFEQKYAPNFSLTNKFKCNIIHDLCFQSQAVDNETSKVLLKYFINQSKCIANHAFSVVDNSKKTPLHYAVLHNKPESVALLLPFYKKNDLVNIKDNNNKSIMQYARKYPQIMDLLVAHSDDQFDDDQKYETRDIETDEDESEVDDEKTDEDFAEFERLKAKETKLVYTAFSRVSDIIRKYNPIKFVAAISSDCDKKHLRGLDLNTKQLKTAYCLENQTLEFIFHFYGNDREEKWQQPIAFWVTYDIIDDMVRNNFSNIDSDKNIQYKLGALSIDKDDDEPLFIKGVLNTLRQSNAIEQPFHIQVTTTKHSKCIKRKATTQLINIKSTDINSFADGLSLPVKAVKKSFKTLYPMQIYEKRQDDDKYAVIKDIAASSWNGVYKMFAALSDLVVNVTDRLTVIIPASARVHSFKVKAYTVREAYLNDIRFEILCDNDYIAKTKKIPIKVRWKLDKHYKYTKNRNNENQYLFKIYFHLKLLDVWCTGNKNQLNMLHKGHPLTDMNGDYFIETDVFGAYDMHIRQQINFYDQYIDKFCFNDKYYKDFTNPPERDLKRLERGGRAYYVPKGWKVHAVDIGRNNLSNVIKTGCAGFHSTSLALLPSILRDGLVVPGTTLSMTGYRLPIPPGHITASKISGVDDDDFTNNVFASPSINYCSYAAYCKAFKLSKYNKYNTKFAHLALKVFIKAEAIRVNKETIGWSSYETKIDPNYNNNELEWRVRDPSDLVITGLCIHESDVSNKKIWKIKRTMRNNKNPLHEVRDVFELKDVFNISIIDKTNENKLVKLEKYVLCSTKIGDIKKMYLEQINDKTTNIKDLLLFDFECKEEYDDKDAMLDDNTLDEYDINKAKKTTIYTVFPYDCSICLEAIKQSELIKLECCGLALHIKCLQQLIANKCAGFAPGNKISLQQLSCLMCRKQMKHNKYGHLFTKLDQNYIGLKHIALKQLEYDNKNNDQPLIHPAGAFYNDSEGYAMKQYAFYMCYKCKDPYCGGETNCIQEMKQDSVAKEERICLYCTPALTQNDAEFASILRTMAGSAVYLCPNNHIYFVGNCAFTSVSSKCSTCGAMIGNEMNVGSHNTAKGNKRIGKIDRNGKLMPCETHDPYTKRELTEAAELPLSVLYNFTSKIK